MAIEATCPGCNEFFRLPDNLAGKQVCCQRCQKLWTVPTVSSPPEEPEAAEVAEEIIEATPTAPPPAAKAPAKPAAPAVAAKNPPKAAKPKADPDVIDAVPAPKAKSKSKPAKPAAPQKSSNLGCLLAALALFLMSMVGAGGAAAIVVVMKLNPAPVGPGNKDLKDVVVKNDKDQPNDKVGDKDIIKDKINDKITDKDKADKGLEDKGIKDNRKDVLEKDKDQNQRDKDKDDKRDKIKDAEKDKDARKDKDGPPKPAVLAKTLDSKERHAFADALQAGKREYRVHMQFGKRYNFHVESKEFAPRLQLNDGAGIAVTRAGEKAAFLSHVAVKTGEHTLIVSPQAARNIGSFDFKFAQSTPDVPTSVVIGANAPFTAKDSLRIHDMVAIDWPGSPIREYRMPVTVGTEYELTMEPIGHAGRLRVYEGAAIDAPNRNGDWAGEPGAKKIDVVYKATFSGVVTITAASDDQTLGSYVLTVKRRAIAIVKDKAPVREVAFDFAGKFHKDDLLDDNDPFEGRYGRSKVYLIPMEAGQSYNIDQKSKEIDSFLSLLDPQGKLVAEDNNGGGNYNSRLLFDAKTTGKYRLLASDFKRKTGDFSIDIVRFKTPAAVGANGALAIEKRQQDGLDVMETTAPPILSQNTSFAWSPDGKAFFILDKNDTLRRFRFPELIEDRRLELSPGENTIHLCGEGILVSNTKTRELWIVHPDTLELRRRLPRLGNVGTFTAPALSMALISGNLLRQSDGAIVPGMGRHDLTKSVVTYMSDLPKGTIFQAITPDEKYLLTRNQDNKMMRIRLDQKKAFLEEISTANARSWFGANHPYLVSPDGRLVLHPVNTKTIPKDDVQPAPASGYGIAAYRVTDLRRPVFVFDTGVSTNAVAFDPKSGYLIAQNRSKGLMVIDPQGRLVRSFDVDFGAGADLWNMVAHPNGGKILGFTGATTNPKLFVVDLPRDIPGIKIVEDKGGPRKVALNAAEFYSNEDRLLPDDPRDNDGLPFKTYLLPLEAGWAYSIDQKSTKFDSYMKLVDPDGKIVADDEDSGGDVNSRILIEPKASGEYKLLASRKRGNAFGDFMVEITRYKMPVKEAVNKSLALKKSEVAGASIVETFIGQGQAPMATNSSLFTPDGKAIVVLDADGWLHRIRVPDVFEEHRLQLGRDFKQIYETPDGILVSNVKLREIWIIDPDDLKIVKRLPMIGGPQVHAAPGSLQYFTPAIGKLPDGKSVSMVVGQDLHGKLPPVMTGFAPGAWGIFGLTPDGKYMIGRAPKNELVRWKTDDRKLTLDQAGDAFPLIFTIPPVFISGDSRWVMRPVDKKTGPTDAVQPAPASGFGLVVYSTGDLSKPAFVIDTDSRVASAASDPKHGHLITHSATKGLMICDLDGKILREIPIAMGVGGDARVWRFAVAPTGGKLIAFTGTNGNATAFYVELPKDLPPVKTVVVKAPDPIKGGDVPKGLDPNSLIDRDTVIRRINGIFAEPLWSLDGKSFYLYQSQQGFLEVDAQTFKINKKNLDFADSKGIFLKGKMAWSSEGLLAAGFDGNPDNGANMKLFVIDPEDLKIKKQIPVPNTTMVQSAPNLGVAFAGGRNAFAGGMPSELLIVDLKSGKVTKPNVEYPIQPDTFKVSPDGKFFYATDTKTIARFKIEGTNLVQDEISDEIAVNKFQQQLEMSIDGKLVWLLSQNIPPSQAKVDFPTTFLDALDLKKVDKVVKHRAFSFAIDPLNQHIHLGGGDQKLRELARDGSFAREFDVKATGNFRPILQMHPSGGAYLIHSGNVVFHVRLPEKMVDFPKKMPDELKKPEEPKKKPEEPKLPPNMKEIPVGLDPEPRQIRDLTVHTIKSVMHQAIWHPDGQSFFAFHASAGLQEIDAKELLVKNRQELKVDGHKAQIMGQPCWGADGLLAMGFSGNPEKGNKMDLLIIDPKTLAVTRILPAPNASLVQSAKNLPFAFLGGRNLWSGGKAGEFRMIDLRTGFISRPNVKFPIDAESFKVTPDGKYLFATDGHAIARFKIDGINLVHEQTSSKILGAKRGFLHLEMSTTGDVVWLTSYDSTAPFVPEDAAIELFDAKDLTRPPRVLKAPVFSAAIEPRDRYVVVTETRDAVRIVNEELKDVHNYNWEVGPNRRLVMNPLGGSALLHAGTTLHILRLPPAGGKAR